MRLEDIEREAREFALKRYREYREGGVAPYAAATLLRNHLRPLAEDYHTPQAVDRFKLKGMVINQYFDSVSARCIAPGAYGAYWYDGMTTEVRKRALQGRRVGV